MDTSIDKLKDALQQVRRLDAAIRRSEGVLGIDAQSRRRERLHERRRNAQLRVERLWQSLHEQFVRIVLKEIPGRAVSVHGRKFHAVLGHYMATKGTRELLKEAGLVNPPGLEDAELRCRGCEALRDTVHWEFTQLSLRRSVHSIANGV